RQRLCLDPTLKVITRSRSHGLELELETSMDTDDHLRTDVDVASDEDGWLAIAIRPYNPEGVQFIHKIQQLESGRAFRVNQESTVDLDSTPDAIRMAHYAEGDVYLDLSMVDTRREISCDVGM